jgi:hypothetical protein
MNDEATAGVVELAKDLMAFLQSSYPGWRRGFLRFRSDSGRYGSNASFEVGDRVELISAVRNAAFYDRMNETSRSLFSALGKDFGVLLITVTDAFEYNVEFEWANLTRWEITKMNGASGLPKQD